MNKKTIFFLLTAMSLTITTEAKISIQSIQNRISNFFHKNKYEQTEQTEYNDIKKIELFCDQGNISIHTWKQPSTMLETKKVGTPLQHKETTVTYHVHENILQVQTNYKNSKSFATIHFNIIVPENTEVKIATKHGNIFIKNLLGIIEAHTDHGNIEIIDGTNTTTVQTTHGNITIQREQTKDKTMISAQSSSGNITLQIPQHINSKIEAQSKHGKIYSDLLITLNPHTMKLNDETYKQQRHSISGYICDNQNTQPIGMIKLQSNSGTIKIKPYV